MTEAKDETSSALYLSSGQLNKILGFLDQSPTIAVLDEAQRDLARESLTATLFKFELATVHLEHLWRIREEIGFEALLTNSAETHRWDSSLIVRGSLHLDGFLYQSRAFLDALMLHSLHCFGVRPGNMSTRLFRGEIRRVASDPARAKLVEDALLVNVFGENCWGSLVRSLRDRIAHGRHFTPTEREVDTVGSVTLDWPTIRSQAFHTLAQEFSNESFELFRTLTPVLYGIPWRPGV